MRTSETIRQALRAATVAAHAELDGAMSALDLTQPDDYATFLRIQFAARGAIEDWVAEHCPFDLQPPSQTALIAADLNELGADCPAISCRRFTASPDGALGIAWALGGSSLGNRAMLAGLRKRGAKVPVRFLADEAMPAFFARLRPRFERPADDCAQFAESVAAAHAVFARFAAVSAATQMKLAA